MMRSALSQIRSCSAVISMWVAQGMVLGWTSPALAKLASGQGPFQPSLEELSWIASVLELGLVLGVVVSAAVFSRLGRRQTVLVAPVTLVLWVLMTYFGESTGWLCAAGVLAGTGQGASLSFTGIYIAEVTTPRLRPALVFATSVMLPFGMFLSYSLMPLVSFHTQSLLPAPLVVLAFALHAICMKESPFHLVAKGRPDSEVRAVLGQLRSGVPTEEVAKEADSIVEAVRAQLRDAASWRELFAVPGSRRAALVVLVECGLVPMTGLGCVTLFAIQIFQAAGTPMQPELCSSLLFGLKLGMVPVAVLSIVRVGCRMQLFLASMVNVLTTASLSGYFLARDNLHLDVSSATWLPMVALFVFIAACGLGGLAVPNVLMSELLSHGAKAIVAPAAIIIMSLTAFALNKTFLLVGVSVGFYLPFAGFAVANLLVAIFTFFMVPDTVGKTLVEVQDMLAREGKRPRGTWLTQSPEAKPALVI